MSLRVLIADDEKPARQKLRRFLSEHADIGPVHEAADGPAALALIRDVEPDLAFLDIQMPGMTGVELARVLQGGPAPHLVFVTAYDRFAVDAFDVAAVDYVLKPFDRDRLSRALDRARDAVRSGTRIEDLQRALRLLATQREASVDRIAVQLEGRTILVPLAQVERIEGDRNHVVIHVPPQRYRVRGTVTAYEERLDPRRFARVGRGTIVNVDWIVELRPLGHGDSEARLRSGAIARVGRRYRDRFAAVT
jgi:two-component system LytT family response regulator